MEVGGMVTIVAENGDKTPATEGEYELEDGSLFTVDATGMITEVKAKEEEEEEVIEAVAEIPVEMSTEEKFTELIKSIVTSMSLEMAKATAQEIQSVKTELTKQIADAKSVVVELSSETKAIPEVVINLSEMSPVQKFRAGKVELK
jgi:hypothetical protein